MVHRRSSPRAFVGLSNLTRSDDLLDLEFMWTCRRLDYPVVEFPIAGTPRFSGRSTTGYMTALRLYWAAFRMWHDVKTTAKFVESDKLIMVDKMWEAHDRAWRDSANVISGLDVAADSRETPTRV